MNDAGVRKELEDRLREELDYRQEAANLARFRVLFADDDEIAIPEAIAPLSTSRVLTMTFLDGYPLSDVLAPGVDQELKDWRMETARTVNPPILAKHLERHAFVVAHESDDATDDAGVFPIDDDGIVSGVARHEPNL